MFGERMAGTSCASTPWYYCISSSQVYVNGVEVNTRGAFVEENTVPDYYKIALPVGIVTPFDLAEALEFNFNRGCVLKYLLRAGRKGDALVDLKKARNCLDREISRLEPAS